MAAGGGRCGEGEHLKLQCFLPAPEGPGKVCKINPNAMESGRRRGEKKTSGLEGTITVCMYYNLSRAFRSLKCRRQNYNFLPAWKKIQRRGGEM